MLYKVKAVLPREALLKLYYALVQPYLLYGLELEVPLISLTCKE